MSFSPLKSLLPSQIPTAVTKGTVHFALYEDAQYLILGLKSILKLTPQDLCNGPYIIRVEDPTYGRTYFVGDDEPYLKLQSEGKNVKWLHDLFEHWRQNLIRLGLPKDTSIYKWTLHDIHIHEMALKTFPGATVEVLQ